MSKKLSVPGIIAIFAVIALLVLLVNKDKFLITTYELTNNTDKPMTAKQLEAEYKRKAELEKSMDDSSSDDYIYEIVLGNKPNMAIHKEEVSIAKDPHENAKLEYETDSEILQTMVNYINDKHPSSDLVVQTCTNDIRYSKMVVLVDDEAYTFVGTHLDSEDDDKMFVYYVLGD